jgi:hypothetical protein
MEQLHKSLFDAHSVRALVVEAGFTEAHIFRYAFEDEPNAVCLAFIAQKSEIGALNRQTILAILESLAPFTRMRQDSYEVIYSTYEPANA